MTASARAVAAWPLDRGRVLVRTTRAVLTRELRWRMRGRRAFVVTMVAVLLMGLFVVAIHQVLAVRALGEAVGDDVRNGISFDAALSVEQLSGAASVRIGRAIFAGLLGLLTVITLVIAPALASGAISTEREKQTLELVVTAPVSTLGLVVGKLAASLAYVVLVIAASLPLMCVAFSFGGIGPEDVLSAYAMVLALAFGSAAIGMYLSALLGRTQLAALASYLVLLGLIGATLVVNAWLAGSFALSQRGLGGDGGGDHGRAGRQERRADRRARLAERQRLGRLFLVMNPVAADLDIVCTAMPEVRGACSLAFMAGPVQLSLEDQPHAASWPRSALAFALAGGVLTILSTQHISPSRRIRSLRRLRRPRRPRSVSDAARTDRGTVA